jgi:hypothetical protein
MNLKTKEKLILHGHTEFKPHGLYIERLVFYAVSKQAVIATRVNSFTESISCIWPLNQRKKHTDSDLRIDTDIIDLTKVRMPTYTRLLSGTVLANNPYANIVHAETKFYYAHWDATSDGAIVQCTMTSHSLKQLRNTISKLIAVNKSIQPNTAFSEIVAKVKSVYRT